MPSDTSIAAVPNERSSTLATQSRWVVFAIACGGTFLVSLDSTIAIAAFPPLREAFPSSPASALTWVLNAYTIVYAALLIPFGRLADKVGARSVYLWGVAVFGLASLACGLAANTDILVMARVFQAVGGAMLTPASLTLILTAFPPEKRAAVVGLWSAVSALAAALGPGIGGLLIELGGWRLAFLINIPVAIALIMYGRRLVRGPGGDFAARLDLPGTLLIILALGALTYGIVSVETTGWLATPVIAGFASGSAAVLGYLFWARGRRDATIDLALFNDRVFAFATLAVLVFGVAFSMLFLGYFLFLIEIWQFGQAQTGLAVMPGPLTVIPVAILGGRLVGRIGHRPLLLTGAAGFTAAQVILYLTATETASFWAYWFPLQILGGISVGLLLPPLSGAAVAFLPATRFGVGGAVHNSVRQFGAVVGTAVTVLMVGQTDVNLETFRGLFVVLAGLGVLTGLLCLPINTRPRSALHPESDHDR